MHYTCVNFFFYLYRIIMHSIRIHNKISRHLGHKKEFNLDNFFFNFCLGGLLTSCNYFYCSKESLN